MAVPSYYVLT